MDERKLTIGTSIIYLDEHRVAHPALVTHVWEGIGGTGKQGCNLVYVSGDETKSDPYGRQIERNTSVVHLSSQPAGAWCWCWPDEVV